MEDEIYNHVGDNYKGIFYYEDEPEERYFEFGAHFKYKELYKKLERLLPSNDERHLNSLNDNDKNNFLKEEEKKSQSKNKHNINEVNPLSQQININLNNIYINNDPAIAGNTDIENVQHTLMNILGTNKSRNNPIGLNNNLNNVKSRNVHNDLTYQVHYNNAIQTDFNKKISLTNQKSDKINVNNVISEEKNKQDRNSKMSLTILDNKNHVKSYINKEKDNTFMINKSNSNANKTMDNTKSKNINNIKSRNVLINNKSQLLKITDHTKSIVNNRQTVEELLRKEQNKSKNKNKINTGVTHNNNPMTLQVENKFKKLECRKIHITSTKNKEFKEIDNKESKDRIDKSKNKNDLIYNKDISKLKTINGHFIKLSEDKTLNKTNNNNNNNNNVFIQGIVNNATGNNVNKNSRNLNNNKLIATKSNIKSSTITINKTKDDSKSKFSKNVANNNVLKSKVNESTTINFKDSSKLNILGKNTNIISNEKSNKKTTFIKDPIKRTIKIINNKPDSKNSTTLMSNKLHIQSALSNDKSINKSSSLLLFKNKESGINMSKNQNKISNCITESNLKYPTLKNYNSEINFKKSEESRNIKSDDFTSKTLSLLIGQNNTQHTKDKKIEENLVTVQEIKINKPLPLNKIINLKPGSVLSNYSDKSKFSNNQSLIKNQNSKLPSLSSNSQYSQKNRFYQKSIMTSNICLDQNNVKIQKVNITDNKKNEFPKFNQIKS